MFRSHLMRLAVIRNFILKDIFSGKKNQRIHKLYGLIENIISSGEALALLLRNDLVTESIILSRAFMEGTINYCYLLICDDDVFNNHLDYSIQKGYRTALSDLKAIEALGVKETLSEPDDVLKSKLDKFTSSTGKPINRWTKLSLKDRIDYLNKYQKNFVDKFMTKLFALIYEEASEALHGTLYGTMIDVGVYRGKSCPIEVDRHRKRLPLFILVNFCILLQEVIQLLHKNTEWDLNNLLEETKKIFDEQTDKIMQYLNRANFEK